MKIVSFSIIYLNIKIYKYIIYLKIKIYKYINTIWVTVNKALYFVSLFLCLYMNFSFFIVL